MKSILFLFLMIYTSTMAIENKQIIDELPDGELDNFLSPEFHQESG